ncbi:uncharacterized protein LOC133830653 [Humulus lupulus]|uniref:uncharacterized protein LOC133830653 n=1 Tax=Humulus lupulus TaxID=3486 RepID=UPI002B4088F8|nr:uncharacterized protein LOC133830653 [Humulus lupulus]
MVKNEAGVRKIKPIKNLKSKRKMEHAQVLTLANDVNKLWYIWNLRVCIVLSLFLQFVLVVYASKRKRSKSNLFHLWFWSAYLLADWIAAYALGQIVQIRPGDDINDPNKSSELNLFWAQFLLLHLAGPDSITSLSPGDSGVWLSTLIRFLCQVVATIFSFVLLALAKKNKLWIPTILVFSVGLIRSYEKVKTLIKASFDRLGETLLPEPNPGPDYEDAVSTDRPRSRSVQVEERPIVHSEHDDLREVYDHEDIRLLCAAHSFFEDFKVLFTGSLLSLESRDRSRDNFLRRCHSDAFKLVEYELSLLHDLMHTKTAVLLNTLGYIRRFICFSSVLAATILFFLSDITRYTIFDVCLTGALLVETIFFDIISLIHLIFSEWCFIRSPRLRPLTQATILKRQRWSNAFFQYNIFRYCLDQRWSQQFYTLAGYLFNSTGFTETLREIWYSPLTEIPNHVKESIFEELKMKSSNANDLRAAKEACSQRGIWSLSQLLPETNLRWSIEEFEYLDSLLLWHIATELCYQNLDFDDSCKNEVRFCKFISNYMFYLLVAQPTMLSQEMGNLSIVLQDTQAEAKNFFTKHSISHHRQACNKLFSVRTPQRPAAVKGSQSKSLLFDGCILAKELQDLKELQWKVMSQLWIELMCFAAINCSPATHAQQPSRGGELLTFTWLLMNHLGLGTQFS